MKTSYEILEVKKFRIVRMDTSSCDEYGAIYEVCECSTAEEAQKLIELLRSWKA